MALGLVRLDELQQVFYRRAIEDVDIESGLLVTKLIERRCGALGLNASQAAVLQIIESTAPKESTFDEIGRAIAELSAQDRKGDPTTY